MYVKFLLKISFPPLTLHNAVLSGSCIFIRKCIFDNVLAILLKICCSKRLYVSDERLHVDVGISVLLAFAIWFGAFIKKCMTNSACQMYFESCYYMLSTQLALMWHFIIIPGNHTPGTFERARLRFAHAETIAPFVCLLGLFPEQPGEYTITSFFTF